MQYHKDQTKHFPGTGFVLISYMFISICSAWVAYSLTFRVNISFIWLLLGLTKSGGEIQFTGWTCRAALDFSAELYINFDVSAFLALLFQIPNRRVIFLWDIEHSTSAVLE